METNAVRLFDILGFQIKVQPSWLLIAALVVWSLSSGFFPEEVPGLAQSDYIALSVAAMLGMFFSLILHELSHSLVAQRFGLGIGGITLFIFGGVAELDEEPFSPKSEFWIAVAGPITSLALAALAYLALSAAIDAQISPALQGLLRYLALVNVMLALFNLMPAFPLDGGRIFRAALWQRSGDLIAATRIASSVGAGFAYALIALGFLALFLGMQFGALWQILIGLFLLSATRATYQELLIKSALAGKTVGAMMTQLPKTVEPDQTLSDLVDKVMLAHVVSFVPVCEGDHLLGHVDARTVQKIDRENWTATHVADIYVAADKDTCIPPDLPTETLLKKMMHSGHRKFMVVKDQRLLGVITLSDLLNYLSVLNEVGGFQPPATRVRKPANS